MTTKTILRAAIIAGSIAMSAAASAAPSGVFITEWMYSGNGGEFMEFTNLTGADVDFTGWSYSDSNRLVGSYDLSGFGIVAAGESVIMTEDLGEDGIDDAETFRADWNLSNDVKILGGNTQNIGRGDEINLYNAFGELVDSLTYGDNAIPGTIRTQRVSGRPGTPSALGLNDVGLWVFSEVGDLDGAFYSNSGDLGSPGSYNPVPVPAAAWLFGSAIMGLLAARRRAS